MAKGNEILLEIAASTKDFNSQMKAVSKKIDGLTKKTKKASEKQSASWKSAGNSVKAFVGIMAAKIGVDAVRAMANLAGEISTVEKTFQTMVQGAGKSSDALLKSVQAATKGTVSNLDIMKSTNLAIGLMGDQVIDKIPQMAKIARAAASLQGKSVAKMLEDIVVASGRQSVMILDNLGISSTEAGKKMDIFAARLGKTRDQLTASQKKAAFFFAVMESGKDIIDKAGVSALTFGEKLQVIKTNMANVFASISKDNLPLLNDLANEFTQASKKGGWLNDTMIVLGKTMKTVIGVTTLAVRVIRKLFLLSEMKTMENKIEDITKKMKELTDSNKVTFSKGGLRGGDNFIAMYNKLNKELDKATAKQLAFANANEKTTKGLTLTKKLLFEKTKQRDFSKTTFKSRKPGGGGGIGGGGGKKQKPFSELGALEFAGETREAELLKLDERFQKLQTMYKGHKDELLIIEKGYDKQRKDILLKHDTLQHSLLEGYKQAGINAASSFENATKASLKEALLGGNGWKAFAQSAKDILASLVADLIVAIGKALVLRAVVGSTTGLGAGSAAGLVASSIFEKGRVPAFPMGRVPADHELAYVGRKEAIINAESTKANANLLARINASNGQQVQTGGGQALNLTINNPVMSRDYTERVIFKHLEDFARSRGKKVFSTA